MSFVQTHAFDYHRLNNDPTKKVVRDEREFWDVIRYVSQFPSISFDTETSGIQWFKKARTCGYSVSVWNPNGEGSLSWYMPFRHQTGEKQLPVDVALNGERILLESQQEKIVHNLKFERHMAHADGIGINGPRRDTMVEAHLYDENYLVGLKERAMRDLGDNAPRAHELILDKVLKQRAKDAKLNIGDYKDTFGYAQIPIELAGIYACYDTATALNLSGFYDARGVRSFFADVYQTEIDVSEVCFEMEQTGIPVDVPYLLRLKEMTSQAMEMLAPQIYSSLGGYTFDLGSDDELREVLQRRLGLHLWKKTDSGKLSVDKEVLQHFAEDHPACALMLEYRTASKIKSTYTDSIIDRLDANNVLHGSFKPLGTNCMPAGELVLTTRGYLPVEQVRVGDRVLTHQGRPRKVVAVVPNGVQPIVKVALSNGLALRTTANHAYRTGSGGWKEAGALTPGDVVQVHSSTEEWRAIPLWSDFAVSSWGRVRNNKTGRVATLRPKGKWGHLKVTLRRNGAQIRGPNLQDIAVHRLVAAAFVSGNTRTRNEVRHLNGFAWDNTASNLRWGTSLENRRDAVAHGTMSRRNGSQNVLTEDLAHAIRAIPEHVFSHTELAAQCGVSRALIRGIRRGKRWVRREEAGKRAKFTIATVISVETQSAEVTYGLTVEEDHSHVTGGIVTHNTGRLSSSDPNMQNFASDSDARALAFSGKKLEDGGVDPWSVKRAFLVWPDWARLHNDYSQIELRVLAEYSGDPVMVEVYAKGEDIHNRTSQEVFGTMEKARRRIAKVINFGLVYMLSAAGLSRQAKIPMHEAEQFMRTFFQRYTGIEPFRESFFAYVRANGGAFMNMFGRPRRVPNINASEGWLRGRSERQTIGSLVQGTAAWLTKVSLVRIHKWEQKNRSGLKFSSTIHDEISIDAPMNNVIPIARAVKREMEDFKSHFHRVPIVVEQEISTTNTSEKHKLKAAA